MTESSPAVRRRVVFSLLLIALPAPLASCGGDGVSGGPRRCAIGAPALVTGRLHPDGTRLLDEHQRVVTLRGFDAGSRSKWAPYAPFDFAQPDADGSAYRAALARYLDVVVLLGANVLRVPFSWQALEPERGRIDQDYLARYDALLDAAWARGIRTVVDFHQDVYAENFCGDGFPAWTIDAQGGPLPAPHHDCPRWFESYSSDPVKHAFDRFWADGGGIQTDFVAMWKRMLARHRDRGGVVGFEPINEPSAGSATRADFEPTTLTAFLARMTALVNADAPSSLVFLDPLGITSALHTTLLGAPTGTNVVYAPHYYQPTTIFGGTGSARLVAPDLEALQEPGSRWKVPTFVGEWGAGNEAEDAAEYVAAHLGAFDQLGLSGTQWELSVAKESWNSEPLDVVFPDGRPRPVASGWMRPTATAIAGTPLEVAWDAQAFAFTLRYRPGSAIGDAPGNVTEVVLPISLGEVRTLDGACFDDGTAGKLLLRADGSGDVRLDYGPVLHTR